MSVSASSSGQCHPCGVHGHAVAVSPAFAVEAAPGRERTAAPADAGAGGTFFRAEDGLDPARDRDGSCRDRGGLPMEDACAGDTPGVYLPAAERRMHPSPEQGCRLMHMNLRRYARIGVDRAVIEASVKQELLPELLLEPGFMSYIAFWDAAGAGVSLSCFQDAETAHRATTAARQWLARHRDFFPAPGDEFSGACFVHEEAPSIDAAAGRGLPYLLIRRLSGVPASQDTLAFVEQRTLPMIERAPGYQAVWMARGDREVTDAAVATFFDGADQARQCHRAAEALLREGLPGVSVTLVMEGRAVIALRRDSLGG